MPAPVSPRDPRPLAGLLLGAASIANLTVVFGLLRTPIAWGFIPSEGALVLIILLAMLQGWSGSQALEGRRLAIARIAVALSGVEGILAAISRLWEVPAIGIPAGVAVGLGLAALLPLLPRKTSAAGKGRSTTL